MRRYAVNTLSLVPGRVGGGETYLVNLVAGLVEMLQPSERLLLLLTPGNRSMFAEEGGGVEHAVLPVPRRARGLRLALEHLVLPFVLPARGVDVLLSPGNAVPLLAGVRHVLALQSMHYRVVAEEMSPFRVAYFKTLVPLSAGRAARVLLMSEDLRRSLLEVWPRARSKSSVVYEGADLAAFHPEGPKAPGDYVLYVSSLNPFKRPDSLVRALAEMRRRGEEPPEARFAGRPNPRDRRRVEDLARELGVEDLVRVLGVVDHLDLAPLYRGARCLVYPSAVETFGLPPLEAMACGCPVLASNQTSVPEVVGDAAIVVDPDDVGALASGLRRLLGDPDLREDLRARGYRNARRFSWRRTAAGTMAAMRQAAEMFGDASGRS